MNDILTHNVVMALSVIFTPAICGWFLYIQKKKLERLSRKMLIYKRTIDLDFSALESKLDDGLDLLRDVGNKINHVDGQLKKNYITSKIAEKYAQIAHEKALEALSKVIGMEKSTHRVQFMPMEKVLEKNKLASAELKKILNPSDEESDWLLPFEDEIEDSESFMPNARAKARVRIETP